MTNWYSIILNILPQTGSVYIHRNRLMLRKMTWKKLKMFLDATTEAAGEIIGIGPEVHEELGSRLLSLVNVAYKKKEEVAM